MYLDSPRADEEPESNQSDDYTYGHESWSAVTYYHERDGGQNGGGDENDAALTLIHLIRPPPAVLDDALLRWQPDVERRGQREGEPEVNPSKGDDEKIQNPLERGHIEGLDTVQAVGLQKHRGYLLVCSLLRGR